MGRETALITIEAEGRDKGKTFLLTEMSGRHAESWALRAIEALGRGGVEIPDNFSKGGWPALLSVGIRALTRAPFEYMAPLYDEMMGCVQFVAPAMTRALVDDGGEGDDIEEVVTRLKLRDEVIRLHTGFSPLATLSILARVAEEGDESGSPTPISPEASAQ